MISSFDFVKLNALLKDFYNLTRMRITVFDDSFREIASYPEKVAPICRFIRAREAADRACRACDVQACRRAAESHATTVYRCHAGLTEAVAPVYMGNVVIAYLSFGHLFAYEDREAGFREIAGACETYGLDAADLRPLVDALPYTAESYILSAAHILEAVASFLCLDRMITLKQQALQVQIDEYLTAHFAEDLRADTISERFGISRTALYEFSKQNYGMGIARHVRKLRIEHAQKLLMEAPEMTVGEIAEACGFADYNYFITVFSRMTGVPPRKWRQQALEKTV